MSGGRLRFDRFEFDLGSSELRESGTPVRLRHQSSRALGLLISRPGELVGREELRAHLWGDDTFVDFDQGLNQCIKEIRAALGDSATSPAFVETLPRRGYRWIAALSAPPEPALSESPRSAPSLPVPVAQRPPVRRPLLLAAAALAVLALIWLGLPREHRASELRWQRLTFQRGRISAARFLPGGGVALSAAWEGGLLQLQTLGSPLDAGPARPIDWLIGVTPAGEAVTLFGAVLTRHSLPGGEPTVLAQGVLAADVSKDGALIAAAVWDGGVHGVRVELPLGHVLGRLQRPTHLRLSPDGRRLAVIEHPLPDDDSGSLKVYDREGGVRTLGGTWSSLQGVAWTPDGSEIWITGSRSGTDNELHAVDAGSGRMRVLLAGGGRLGIHDLGGDGRVLLERSTSRMHMMFGRPGQPERDLAYLDGSYPVALSRDGKRLLFGEGSEAGGAAHSAWIRPTDGGAPLPLGRGRPLGFTRDGAAALLAPGLQSDHLEVVSLATRAVRVVRVGGIGSFLWAGAHPLDSGRLLLAGAAPGHGPRLYEVSLDGGAPVPLTPEQAVTWREPASPDGRALLAPCRAARACLYTEGHPPQPVVGLATGLPIGWDSTGQRLQVFERLPGARARIFSVDPRTGQHGDVVEVAPRDGVGVVRIGDAVVTPDGTAWAYSFLRRNCELFAVEGLPVPGAR